MTTRAREVEALLEWLRRQAEHHEQMAAEAEATDHMSPLHFHGGMAIALADYASALAGLIAECEWLPIASAPKDGTEALFWQPGNKRAGVNRARRACMRIDHLVSTAGAFVGYQEFPESRYTHWRPLPPPPAPELITGEVGHNGE